jgi:MFS family permease
MAGAQSLFFACLLSVLGGTGNGIQWVSVMTALQEATPQEYQARVVGLLESALAAMPGVGYLIGGILATIGSPRTAYAVAGAGTLLIVVVALGALRGLRLKHPARRSSDHEATIAPELHRTSDAREVSFEAGER